MIKLEDVERGYARWAAKPHNAKWVRRIDGTPIANDICVNIFEELKSVSPSPVSADAVVEACAKVADDLAKEWEGDAELWHKDGMLKTAAISLLHSEAARKVAAPIRALKGTFPAAPEAKSEVAVKALDEEKTQGWMADDGRFCLPMSFGYFIKFPKDDDKTQTFMAWHYHEPVGGSSSIKTVRELAQEHHRRRIRSALVDPEGGV
jgi:hypothetical protein